MQRVLRFKSSLVAVAVALAFSAGAQAQIATDGTLGAATALNGPNFAIGANLGRQVGANLFHSFSTFNLVSGESATFSGPSGIANVISRVTGASASNIDGLIRSSIGGANLFLINPKGILFGPNASLDLTGSFHASTADYLKLGDGGRFDATNPAASVLTSAPPEAFGFLGAAPAAITVQGSRLEAAPGKNLSLVGGDISLDSAKLSSRGGDIRLLSLGGPGEVPANGELLPTEGTQLGSISAYSSELVAESAPGAAPGRILIRGGTLGLSYSRVASNNTESSDAGAIDLRASGVIDVYSSYDGAAISTTTSGTGTGAGARITITSGQLVVLQDTVESVSDGPGRGGDVAISAPTVRIDAGRTAARGAGRGGDIVITGRDVTVNTQLRSSGSGSGDGGVIDVSSDLLSVPSGALVISETAGQGNGGTIGLRGNVLVALEGSVTSRTDGDGAGGDVGIGAPFVVLSGGRVDARAAAAGRGGTIRIEADSFRAHGDTLISSSTQAGGSGGQIILRVTDAILDEGSRIVSTSLPGSSGAAGAIDLAASASLDLIGQNARGFATEIRTAAFGAAAGAGIMIATPLLTLDQGLIRSTAVGGTTAGPIAVSAGEVVTRNGGRIEQDAHGRIALDGTLGAGGTLSGPDFEIGATLGRIMGQNLFHSFLSFELLTGETATFTGPLDIAHIIARVTGTERSFIDGTVRSGIPGADIYLVNPRGLLFGPNATLDLSGSFHASTGDYIKLTDGARFSALEPDTSALTAAAPSAFGFESAAPAALTVLGSQLRALPGQALAFVGGALTLDNASLRTQGGDLRLVSVAGAAEVPLGADARPAGGTPMGDISIVNSTVVAASAPGKAPGAIRVHGASLTLAGSEVSSVNTESGAAAPLHLTATGPVNVDSVSVISSASDGSGAGAAIEILGMNSMWLDGSLRTSATATGQGGALSVSAPSIVAFGEIATTATGSGDGGGILLRGGALQLATLSSSASSDGGGGTIAVVSDSLSADSIRSQASGAGAGGDVQIDVSGSAFVGISSEASGAGRGGAVQLRAGSLGTYYDVASSSSGSGAGGAIEITASQIAQYGGTIQSATSGVGDGGSIRVSADQASINGTGIATIAEAGATGTPGSVTVNATGLLELIGYDSSAPASAIASAASGTKPGGAITITAGSISLGQNSAITSAASDSAAGGDVTIRTGALTMDRGRIETQSAGTGSGGRIDIESVSIQLGNGAAIASQANGEGIGGALSIRTQDLTLASGASISSRSGATALGAGGAITVDASDFIALRASNSLGPSSVRSTSLGVAAGGDIVLTTPLLTLDGSTITTTRLGSGSAGRLTANAAQVVTLNGGYLAQDAHGRIVLDGTLGPAVQLSGPDFAITADLGQLLGDNLFHSFSLFSLLEGETATFSGPGDVRNVLARVTGPDPSSLFGSVRSTIAGASLYLVNPRGILFGATATLDLTGSLYLSSADYLKLGTAGRFDVSTPSASVLTSDAPSYFGFTQSGGPVTLLGTRFHGEPGQSIALVGGAVSVNDSRVEAVGGSIGVVATEGAGEVEAGGGFTATPGVAYADVALTGSVLGVFSADGLPPGRIIVRGGNVDLSSTTVSSSNDAGDALGPIGIYASQTARLTGGALSSTTTAAGRGGDIEVAAGTLDLATDTEVSTTAAGASGDIRLSARDRIAVSGNLVSTQSDGAGKSGDITLSAPEINVFGSHLASFSRSTGAIGEISLIGDRIDVSFSTINSTTEGSINAGRLRIEATDSIMVSPYSYIQVVSNPSSLLPSVSGPGGEITLAARTVNLAPFSSLSVTARGSGDAGSIRIDAERIVLGGSLEARSSASGGAGTIQLTGGALSAEGATISTSSSDIGAAGRIAIDMRERIEMRSYYDEYSGETMGTEVSSTTKSGVAGSVVLRAPEVSLEDAVVSAQTSGRGSGGVISIESSSVSLQSTQVDSSTTGTGAAGSISLHGTERIDIGDGSRIASKTSGAGRGGDISLKSPNIFLGGLLSARTEGEGRAGNISLDGARLSMAGYIDTSTVGAGAGGDVRLIGSSSITTIPDGLFTIESSADLGRGGSILLEAPQIALGAGTRIASRTNLGGDAGSIEMRGDAITLRDAQVLADNVQGSGAAGNITMTATQRIEIGGPQAQDTFTSVNASTGGDGRGGDITLTAPFVGIYPNAFVTSTSGNFFVGSGSGGDIRINGDRVEIAGLVSSSTFTPGPAGKVEIRVGVLELSGTVESLSQASGNAGNVAVSASERVSVTGEVSARTEQTDAATLGGSGGMIRIATPELTVAGSIDASTHDFGGRGGTIEIDAGRVSVDKGAITSQTQGISAAGSIRIGAAQIAVLNGGEVTASGGILADGAAGSIAIDATESLVLSGTLGDFRSSINSTAFGPARGGDITVRASLITLDQGLIQSKSFGFGDAGNVTVSGGRIAMRNGGRIDAGVTLAGRGGSVDLRAAESLTVQGAEVLGRTGDSVVFGDPSGILSRTSGSGRAGDVFVAAPSITVLDGGAISTASETDASGAAGSIRIESGRLALSSSNSALPSLITSSTGGSGAGGSISIDATALDIGAGGAISASSTGGSGAGGSIAITATTLDIGANGRISASTGGSGAGGSIAISTTTLGIGAGGQISASSTGTGTAGSIDITAYDALRLAGGSISTEALASDGGNITIKAVNLVHLKNSEITTSVGSGQGSGGNIFIDPTFVILENSRVVANAFGGAGGNITIVAQYFLGSPNSIVEASSQLGVSGNVQISAPQTDVLSGLPALSAEFFDASGLLREACGGRWQPGSSRLVGVGHGGVALPTSGYVASRYFDDAATPHPDVGGVSSPTRSAESQSPVLLAGICAR